MLKTLIAAALAAAALALAPQPAMAQHVVETPYVVDPAVVHAGADSLDLEKRAPGAPMPELGAEFARPTAFTPDGQVDVPWGDWLAEILKGLLVFVGGVALWLLRRLPANLVTALDMFAGMMGQGRANELLEKAITYGVNTTAGAVKGRTLTVKVGLEVLERALEYAVRHAPNLVKMLGGVQAVREKIIARLELEETAALPAPKPPADTLVAEPQG